LASSGTWFHCCLSEIQRWRHGWLSAPPPQCDTVLTSPDSGIHPPIQRLSCHIPIFGPAPLAPVPQHTRPPKVAASNGFLLTGTNLSGDSAFHLPTSLESYVLEMGLKSPRCLVAIKLTTRVLGDGRVVRDPCSEGMLTGESKHAAAFSLGEG
jgi:hypothetical protein